MRRVRRHLAKTLTMNYDDVIDELGEFGRWQQIIVFALWIPKIFAGMHVLMYAFTGLSPTNGYRCQIPSCEGTNFSFNDFNPDLLFPSFDNTSSDFDPENPNYCRFYNPTKLDDYSCSHDNFTKDIIECPSGSIFTYEDFEMSSTVVTKWDLVCKDGIKGPLIGSAFMIGLMIGSFTMGALSDRYGRKPILFLSILLSSAGGLIGTFMPEYYSFFILRIITGIGTMGQIMNPTIMTMEYMGTKKKLWFLPWVCYKTFFVNIHAISFPLGGTILSLIAIYVNDWFTLQWLISAFSASPLLLWFVIPETPRWLLANNKNEEAVKLMETAAKRNGVTLSPHLLQVKGKDDEKTDESQTLQYGFTDLFDRSLLKITIIMWICWPAVALGYYGITFSLGSLNDNFFVSYILGSLVEIPSHIFNTLLLDIWGRKPIFSFSLIMIGTSCILCGFLQVGVTKTVFALVGKFFAAAVFSIVYQFTLELHPTLLRNTALGMCSTISRVGSILAPFIATYLPLVTNDNIPFLVIGIPSGLAGLLALLLPDTLGSRLPDTLDDLETLKKNSKPAWKCINPMKE